ncbi:MAG: hypothetical protein O7D86_02260 [Proteobacteria bacterium]|nr:hypothetical protein [Pseudomonadota bacterium]
MNRTENPFLATLRLPLKIPPIIITASVLVHIISLFLPWLTGLEFSIKIILTCIPIASICYYRYKYKIYQDKERATELILNAEDIWQVKMNNGVVHQAILGKSLFVHPWLTIISLNYDKQRAHFIFTPEIIDAGQFRRLRVRLRFQIEDN